MKRSTTQIFGVVSLPYHINVHITGSPVKKRLRQLINGRTSNLSLFTDSNHLYQIFMFLQRQTRRIIFHYNIICEANYKELYLHHKDFHILCIWLKSANSFRVRVKLCTYSHIFPALDVILQ